MRFRLDWRTARWLSRNFRQTARVNTVFIAMNACDFPMERARLCLLDVRNMYGASQRKLGDIGRPARELMEATPGLLGQARN